MKPLHLRYKKILLEEAINQGSFAEVYKGKIFDHHDQSYRIAIKVLKKKWVEQQDLINRLQDEAELLAQLKHRNIISALGFTDVADRPAILMEHIYGIDIKKLGQRLHIPTNLCFFIAKSIAAALHSAYRHTLPGSEKPLAVIHRDIKPSNVMLTRNLKVKVLDFGASRFDHKARKGHTTVFTFGSPRYMSNERKKGDRGTHSSDIYSLGILLIELLSGKPLPHPPPNDQESHDKFIYHLIENISCQLPSQEWEKRAKQLLLRMCSFWKTQRCTAEQCIPLFEAFYQQAKGEPIREFWIKNINPIIEKLPQEHVKSTLSGKEISLKPKPKAFTPHPSHILNPPLKPNTIASSKTEQDHFTPNIHIAQNQQKETLQHTENANPLPDPLRYEPENQRYEQHPVATSEKTLPKIKQRYIPPTMGSKPQPPRNDPKPSDPFEVETKDLFLFCVSGALTFSFFHIITYLSFIVAGKTSYLFPEQISSRAAPTTEIQKKIDVTLQMESQYFHWVEIYNHNEELVLLTNGVKKKKYSLLPMGTYTIIAKERHLHKEKKSTYTFESDASIFCGAPNGKTPSCTDHNDTEILSFSTD